MIFLQETHRISEDEITWQTEWKTKIVFNHGASNSAGFAILMSLCCSFQIISSKNLINGKILELLIKQDNQLTKLINIYGPARNCPKEQVDFLQTIRETLNETNIPVIIGGDFNIYIDPLRDKTGGMKQVKVRQQKL